MFKLLYYLFKVSIDFIIFIYSLIFAMLKGLFYLIISILSLIFGNHNTSYQRNYNVKNNYSTDNTYYFKNNKKEKSNYKIDNYTKSSFDKEADLWGLSKEDRRIAKEERMSPADYIEAEERDDDNLDDDD